MSDTENLEGLQQAKTGLEEDSKRLKERRRSLEERAKTLEEKARAEKLAIDKQLVVQILEEENRTHNDAVRELEEKIAKLEQQMKPSAESAPTQTTSEPAQEIPEEVSEGVTVGTLEPPEPGEVEVSQEGSRKKKRNIF